jgi:hypothetical protein
MSLYDYWFYFYIQRLFPPVGTCIQLWNLQYIIISNIFGNKCIILQLKDNIDYCKDDVDYIVITYCAYKRYYYIPFPIICYIFNKENKLSAKNFFFTKRWLLRVKNNSKEIMDTYDLYNCLNAFITISTQIKNLLFSDAFVMSKYDWTYRISKLNLSANIIQKQWKKCISNPNYKICKNRLLREYKNLIDNL